MKKSIFYSKTTLILFLVFIIAGHYYSNTLLRPLLGAPITHGFPIAYYSINLTLPPPYQHAYFNFGILVFDLAVYYFLAVLISRLLIKFSKKKN